MAPHRRLHGIPPMTLLTAKRSPTLEPPAPTIAAPARNGITVRRRQLARVARVAGGWVPRVAPLALSIITFAAGVVLLVSGATPSIHTRVVSLHHIVPLPVLELSHFTGSIAGIALVLLARGIRHRLDAAWHFTIFALL